MNSRAFMASHNIISIKKSFANIPSRYHVQLAQQIALPATFESKVLSMSLPLRSLVTSSRTREIFDDHFYQPGANQKHS